MCTVPIRIGVETNTRLRHLTDEGRRRMFLPLLGNPQALTRWRRITSRVATLPHSAHKRRPVVSCPSSSFPLVHPSTDVTPGRLTPFSWLRQPANSAARILTTCRRRCQIQVAHVLSFFPSTIPKVCADGRGQGVARCVDRSSFKWFVGVRAVGMFHSASLSAH